jgi:hypothetical protein
MSDNAKKEWIKPELALMIIYTGPPPASSEFYNNSGPS